MTERGKSRAIAGMKPVFRSQQVVAPRYLFHWTSAAALKSIAEGAAALKRVPIIKTTPADSAVYRVYPQLRERRVLYAWSHPVTGMASHASVIYAGADAADARVLIFEIKESPAILVLPTLRDPAETRLIDKADLEAADLIYNEIEFKNGVLVREWLILNPVAITRFTANPAALRPYFKNEAAKLRDFSFEYPEATFHIRSAPFVRRDSAFFITITSVPRFRKTIVIPRLEAVLRLKDSSIPVSLRRPFSLDPEFLASCSAA